MGSIISLDWACEMLYAGFRARWVLLGCRGGVKRGEEIKRSGMIRVLFFCRRAAFQGLGCCDKVGLRAWYEWLWGG